MHHTSPTVLCGCQSEWHSVTIPGHKHCTTYGTEQISCPRAPANKPHAANSLHQTLHLTNTSSVDWHKIKVVEACTQEWKQWEHSQPQERLQRQHKTLTEHYFKTLWTLK